MIAKDKDTVSTAYKFLTPGQPNISTTTGTNDTFLKYSESFTASNTGFLSFLWSTNLINYSQGGTQIPVSLEVDDISVSYDSKIPNAIYEDFENALKSFTASSVVNRRTIDCTLPAPAAGIGNHIKTDGDSGRYSFSTNKALCVGDNISIVVLATSNALLNKPANTAGQLMFDFSISDEVMFEGLDIVGLAKQQGTLIKKEGLSTGRVKLNIAADKGYVMNFIVQKNSGSVANPVVHGVAVDNIRFVPSI